MAILLMVLAMAVLNAMDAITKILTAEHSGVQIAWARYFFHLVIMAAFAGPTRLRRWAHTDHLTVQIIRACTLAGSSALIVMAFSRMPLADAVAITFIAPLLIVALSGPLLGERVGVHRWTAVVVGFGGMLILVWPSGSFLAGGAVFAMGAAVLWALGQLLTRSVQGDDPWTTLLYTAVVGGVLLTAAAPFFWTAPSAANWAWFVVIGVMGGISHALIINAFARASASVLAPFNYTLLVWAVLYGWILFGDLPGVRVGVGAAVIIAAGLYVAYRERRRSEN